MYEDLIKNISGYFQKIESIEFAILFGSFAEKKEHPISDIDLAICFKDYNLIELGMHIVRLEQITKRKIDIVVLNRLYGKNPAFTYEIITKGKLIFCRHDNDFIEFKRKTFLYYFDTIQLRSLVDKSFKIRLDENNFGSRNYASIDYSFLKKILQILHNLKSNLIMKIWKRINLMNGHCDMVF